MNNLTKEWKNKFAFLRDELQYIYIKLNHLHTDINKFEDYTHIELLSEEVKETLSEVNARTIDLNKLGYAEINESIFRKSLESYERIRKKYDSLIKDDDLLEAV